MTDRALHTTLILGALFVGLVAFAGLTWGLSVGCGILAGGIWNLANLWCLSHALTAWLAPQRARWQTIGWFLVKFPVLYLTAFGLLAFARCSAVGFGIGFVVVLTLAIITSIVSLQRTLQTASAHGR